MYTNMFFRSSRCSVKTYAKSSPRQQPTIFQMDPPCGTVTLEDVDAIYPIAQAMNNREQRYACYSIYGIDMEKVEKYYHIVQRMQHQYNLQKQREAKRRAFHIKIGKFHIWIGVEK